MASDLREICGVLAGDSIRKENFCDFVDVFAEEVGFCCWVALFFQCCWAFVRKITGKLKFHTFKTNRSLTLYVTPTFSRCVQI